MSRRSGTKPSEGGGGRKVVTTNRRAWHEYFIEEEYEAGIALTGTEIKSIREGRVNLAEAYARIENDEVWLIGMHIAPYDHTSAYFNHEPTRPRRLLLHRKQIVDLAQQVEAKGYTLVPLRVALNRGRAKVDIGLARGKKLYDKRQTIAERDQQRDLQRALRDRER
jgi:SsrA-binding protein